ncbi:unnamed protein product [Coregonus sp. 'balchen']|nr:unnamed protein product [Coregonus sp. 'balchen']
MKFIALALTLVGSSQARALQNDAPSQMEHSKAAAMVMKLSESFDKLHEYAQTASQTLAPYGVAFSTQFLEATKQLHEKVMADVEDLHTQLEPKREKLQQVLQKHVKEYRKKLEPVFQEYVSKRREDMDTLRAKLQPLVDEMRAKVEVTKSKLIPMVEVVRTKLTERLEELTSTRSSL